MNMSALWKVAIVGAAAAFLAAAALASMDATASIGSAAPDFTLEDQDGSPVSLSDHQGKIVVLEWFNEDCPFVQRHYKEATMANLSNKYNDQGVVWLAINTTHYATKENNKNWKKQYNLSYAFLSDNSGKVGKMYGAKTTPHMYIIDKDGTLIYAGGIDDDPDGVKRTRTNYVDKALQEILAGHAVSTPQSTPYGCSVKYAEG